MNRINNILELRQERTRLRMKIEDLEKGMQEDVDGIRNYFRPAHMAMQAAGKMFHRDNSGIAGVGINLAIDMLIRKVILRNAGWIYKLVVPMLLKNVTNNYVASHAENIVELAKSFFKKWTGKNHQAPIYDKGTADINY